MRKHAADKVTKALTANSELNLESSQAESGAYKWESDIFQGSKSKSAYLSKLSHAVSQIKRAPDLAQLGLPATVWVPDQATSSACPDLAGEMESITEPSAEDAHNAALLLLKSDNQHEPSSAQLVSESRLRQMMQDLEDASGTVSRIDLWKLLESIQKIIEWLECRLQADWG